MNKELIEILRELEKKRLSEMCGCASCISVECPNCFMNNYRYYSRKYLEHIFSISL